VTVTGEPLAKGEALVLSAVLQHSPHGCARDQLTVLTGYKRRTRDAYIQRLKQAQLVVEGEATGYIVATEQGRAKMPKVTKLPTGAALLEHWLKELPAGEEAVLRHVAKVSNSKRVASRESISEATGYKR